MGVKGDLTELGEEAVKKAAAEILSTIDLKSEAVLIWKSPTARTQHTASILEDVLLEGGVSVVRSDVAPTLNDLERTFSALISPYERMDIDIEEARRRAKNRADELLVSASDHPGAIPNLEFTTESEQDKDSTRIMAQRKRVSQSGGPTGYIKATEVEAILPVDLDPNAPKVYEDPKDILERSVRALEYSLRAIEGVKVEGGKKLRVILITHLGSMRELLNEIGFDVGNDGEGVSKEIPLAAHFNLDIIEENANTVVIKTTYEDETKVVRFDRKARKLTPAPNVGNSGSLDEIVIGPDA